MKAAILKGARDICCADVAEPEISPRQVLVRSAAAGICGTDLHVYRGEFLDRVRFPAVLGHEFGGEIVEVGRSVKGWRVGDRVTVDPILPCHSCPACLEGHLNACCSLELLGIDLDGGFGQYVAVTAGEFSRALRLLDRGMLHPELLITNESPIEEVAEAFAKVDAQAPEVIKIVLHLGA